MKISNERKGELFIIAEAMLFGFLPIIAILGFNQIQPLFFTGISLLIASILFAIIITIKKEWGYFKTKGIWKDLLLAIFLLNILFYSLLFIGISQTSAGNASLIQNMEAFFAIAILGPMIKHEKITKEIIFGSILTVTGAIIVIFPGKVIPHIGDLIILIAVIFPPLGNMLTQRVRKKVSSTFITFARSLIATPIMLFLAFLLETPPTTSAIINSIWPLLFTGLISLGIRTIVWLEGINLIPITKANSIAVIGPGFTLIFAYFILNEVPSLWQIIGFLPMLIGLQILVRKPS